MKRDIIRRAKPRALKRQIEKDLYSLRKKYTKALRAHDDTALGEWLCDNFYLLEREGRGVLSQLKTAPALPLDADGVVRIYALCLRAVREHADLSEQILESGLQQAGLCSAEVELVPLFLRAALLHTARLGCEETGEPAVQRLSHAVLTLRAMQDWDFDMLLESLSPVEQILMRDPEGIYPQMDETTRFCYRRLTAQAARNAGITEQEAACAALSQAQAGETPGERHVGRLASFGPVLSAKGENRPADGGAFPLACCAMHRYINARVVSGSAFIFSGLGDSPLPNRGGVFQRRCSAPDAQVKFRRDDSGGRGDADCRFYAAAWRFPGA